MYEQTRKIERKIFFNDAFIYGEWDDMLLMDGAIEYFRWSNYLCVMSDGLLRAQTFSFVNSL